MAAQGLIARHVLEQYIALRSRVSFFFQAEDGIRVLTVTGVQTCALPISPAPRVATAAKSSRASAVPRAPPDARSPRLSHRAAPVPGLRPIHAEAARRRFGAAQIGRASCRERV